MTAPPPVPPPLPEKRKRLWRVLDTTSSFVDYLFALADPLPFAAPAGVLLVFLAFQVADTLSGETCIGLFIIGYAIGGIAQLVVCWLLGRLIRRP